MTLLRTILLIAAGAPGCIDAGDPDGPAEIRVGVDDAPIATGAVAALRARVVDAGGLHLFELEPGDPAIVVVAGYAEVSPVIDGGGIATSQVWAIAPGTARLRLGSVSGATLATGTIEVSDPATAILMGRARTPLGDAGYASTTVYRAPDSVVSLTLSYRDARGRTLQGSKLARLDPGTVATLSVVEGNDQLILTSTTPGAHDLALHAGAVALPGLREVVVGEADVARVSIVPGEDKARPGEVTCATAVTEADGGASVLGFVWPWLLGDTALGRGDALCYRYQPAAAPSQISLRGPDGLVTAVIHGSELRVLVPGELP